LEGISQQGQFSVVQTWLVDELSQSEGWRLLFELPPAIHSGRRSSLVVQHSAGVDSCDRRHSLFLLLTNATELLTGWLRQRRVVTALDSAMGAVFIAFGLKLAFDKAR
jgi:hypothetical protein